MCSKNICQQYFPNWKFMCATTSSCMGKSLAEAYRIYDLNFIFVSYHFLIENASWIAILWNSADHASPAGKTQFRWFLRLSFGPNPGVWHFESPETSLPQWHSVNDSIYWIKKRISFQKLIYLHMRIVYPI